ncbi:MAG TPA: efflux RND transporter periplasmic adaptor subunit [Tepidisphaeraceae bacterium]|jgi:RND family efflux transporter MFP subunit|nr:efflux RND transporter periplasmic adaptor subunit [Tepidisphaeraceae bacterium]
MIWKLSDNMVRTILPLVILNGLIGCDQKPPGAPPAPPPPEVSVSHPIQKEVVEWDIYTGHLEAPESVNVAARVSGLVMEMPFIEGSIVKKGDLLAVIDDRPYKADLDLKLADEHKAEAVSAIASLTYNRLEGLRKTNAVSQQDVDNAKATLAQAVAQVASSKAAIETSQLNVEWCRVLSPIAGRVSYKLVTAGNLINGGAGQATLLTTVQSISPIYCYVDVDEHSVLKYQKLAEQRKLASARDGKVPCYIQLGNENGYPHAGFIDFVDNHVDPATGTQRVRGIFKNESGLLTPGFFARLRVPGSGRYQALLIPDTAIGNDQSQHNVLVIDKDNKVSAHPVQLGALFGSLRSIVSGVSSDDRVIVNGQMHVRPGATVTPTEVPVKVDADAFPDPGSIAAQMAATTEAPSDSASNNSSAQTPTTQPAGN